MRRRGAVNEGKEVKISDETTHTTTPSADDESKMQKIITRSMAGLVMAVALALILRCGALYCIFFGIATQIEVFRELVNVRYVEAKAKSMPLFRTLQWAWFSVAMIYTYGDSFHQFVSRHGHLVHLIEVTQYLDAIVFALYCLVFVATVLTFKMGLIRYQISQMVWTLVTVALVVLQTKFLATCTLHGIFWFFFPMAAVASNDVFAYLCGMTFGKKFIKSSFLSLSPKKTWEGFIGAAIFTCLFCFYVPVLFAESPWFICPVDKLTFFPQPMSSVACDPSSLFLPQEYILPQLFGGYTVQLLPIQLHGVAYGVFASLIAPFGGFLASAIKRGYDIKDFDKIIPGHGGMMDRMDCQLIIHLFTYVHLKCFVIGATNLSGVSAILGAAAMLSEEDLALLQKEIEVVLAQKILNQT